MHRNSLHLFAFLLFVFVTIHPLHGQDKYLISGSITDSLTKEPLIGATIFNKSRQSGAASDNKGNYELVTGGGEQVLQFSYIGYSTKAITIHVTADTRLEVVLRPAVTEAGAVVITARNPEENTESTKTGFVELSGKEIRKLPALMGEPDLIRALNYSPGVQSANDGNSGFNVRGGSVDQNLILLDNAVVYNPSHVLGFFSVFNPDIVSSASLIKSGMPVNYGGRISSVLSVRSVDGNFEKHTFSANLGLIYSKATLQGPLVKNKLSYIISFRRSYVNEVMKPLVGVFVKPDSGGVFEASDYTMFDLNAKLVFRPNTRHKFSLMYYQGRDNFMLNRNDIEYGSSMQWGNLLLAFNWNWVINDSSYVLTSLNYSKYDFNYRADQFIMGVDLFSAINNLNYKMEYTNNEFLKGSFKAGIEAKYYRFVPNKFMLTINDVDLDYGSYQDLYAGEIALFASWEKDITEKIRFYGGLRLNIYNHLGPYNEIVGAQSDGIQDTLHYSNNELVKTYTALEPRISVRIQTGRYASLKASYTRNYQYIHVASASSVTLPSDIWIPSTASVMPQFGDQVTLGYYRNFFNDNYTASVEGYYKRLKNQVELLYGLGASIQDVSYENSLTSGKGYATGIEFFIQKLKGNFTGWLGYSLAHSERQFEEINNGKAFPAKYDRRHEISLVANYSKGGRWDFSMAFVYATGNSMTVPSQLYLIGSNILTEYGEINGYRMPAYHRLDISASYHFKPKGNFNSSLNFSVFNVYNRANPFLIFFDIQGDIVQEHNLEITARQISIFPMLPSITWSFMF